MAGVISVRFSKEERAELKRRFQEQGFPSRSAYIRSRCGFDPTGGIDPLPEEIEDLDSAGLLKSFVAMFERQDIAVIMLRGIARSLGVRVSDQPREYTHVAPPAPPDEQGWADVPSAKEERTPTMPAGFTR